MKEVSKKGSEGHKLHSQRMQRKGIESRAGSVAGRPCGTYPSPDFHREGPGPARQPAVA